MKSLNTAWRTPLALVPVILLLASCAAGHSQFTAGEPAGFWYGLWHGIIAVIALVIHIFNDGVLVYEVNNTGGWYDFGFLLGVICIWGGGSSASCKSQARKRKEKDWDEIGDKVEKKVMRKLKAWAESDDDSTAADEWSEVAEKAEKKLRRKIREWAEKE